MSACTFFGQRDCPSNIQDKLSAEIERLITRCGVNTFYVGTQGAFDRIAYAVLCDVRKRYDIKIYRILAYMPKPGDTDTADTILPERLENSHPRHAIVKRNDWMLNRCEYVIAYVTHISGGSYKFVKAAEKKGNKVINLSNKI
ncbi:MAG: hypothetical protein ACI4HO_01240 [Ruminococcus sp.]